MTWLADPQLTVYPQCGHLSTVDRAQGRKSPPSKDRHSNHRTTPTSLKVPGVAGYEQDCMGGMPRCATLGSDSQCLFDPANDKLNGSHARALHAMHQNNPSDPHQCLSNSCNWYWWLSVTPSTRQVRYRQYHHQSIGSSDTQSVRLMMEQSLERQSQPIQQDCAIQRLQKTLPLVGIELTDSGTTLQ